MKPPALLGLRTAVVALALAVLLQLALIWHWLPAGQAAVAPVAAPPPGAPTLAAVAQALAGPLKRSVSCGGDAGVALAGRSPGTSGASGPSSRSGSFVPAPVNDRFLAAVTACQAGVPSVVAVFVLGEDGVAHHSQPAGAVHAQTTLDSGYAARLKQAAEAGREAYLPAPAGAGSTAGAIDVVVPLDAKPPLLVVLRHSLPRLLQTSALALPVDAARLVLGDFSADGSSEAIPGVRGLRLAWAHSASPANGDALARPSHLRWLLGLLTLSMLLLVLAGVYWLTRTHRSSQAALQREVALRDDIVTSIHDGLRIVDRSGCITWVNPAFCEMSGWDASRLIGQGAPYPFWPPAAQADRQQFLDAILAGQDLNHGHRAEFIRPDGTRWTALITARPLGSGDGWVLASTDISREIDTQSRLDRMLRDLEHRMADMQLQDRAQDFLHTITGRAAACLSACEGLARNLAQGRTDALALGTRLASTAAQALHQDIEAFRPLLKGSELPETLALWDVAEFALAREAAKIEALNIKVHNNIARDLPPLVLKKWSLTTVLGNLVSNSVAAMASELLSNRTLTLDSYLDEKAGRVYIRVRDQGCGLPPDQFEAIFERGNSGRSDGNGVGLFRSRHLVQSWGGSLTVARSDQSGPDRGTTLQMVLPLSAGAVAPTPGATA